MEFVEDGCEGGGGCCSYARVRGSLKNPKQNTSLLFGVFLKGELMTLLRISPQPSREKTTPSLPLSPKLPESGPNDITEESLELSSERTTHSVSPKLPETGANDITVESKELSSEGTTPSLCHRNFPVLCFHVMGHVLQF